MRTKYCLTILILFLLSLGCTAPSLIRDQNEQQSAEEQESIKEQQPGEDAEMPLLREVDRWFYYLDVNIDDDVIGAITESEYDMVVIDFIPSESNNTDFPIEEIIENWHEAEHPKLVIAYIDIGQAENFRTYWEGGWDGA